MMTNPPPVAPIEGYYALLRNGEAVGLIKKYQTKITYPYLFTSHLPHMNWTEAGVSDWDDGQYDIIATISPADMQAVASGELERLKEALELAIAANCKMKDALSFYADDGPTPNVDGPWKATSWDFGAFARCTLADVANIEGGKNP